ncbi:MAG: T9SS type A sorting domain-containing protein [Melioribacteraceae bacterium]|nr:T9SS type A sorting domain-containing protein [Melioribacteraceae bacterium]
MKKVVLLFISFFIFIPIYIHALQQENSDWQHYIGNGNSYAIAEDNQYVWVGGAGLSKIDKLTDEVTSYTRNNSLLPDNMINVILVDRNGIKWIGTASGLAKFDGTNWTLFNSNNSGLVENYIYDIKEDATGNLWIGTANGLNKFDGTNWVTYNKVNSWGKGYDTIIKIAISNNGVIWLALSYGGHLAKLEGSTWTVFEPGKSFLPFNIGLKCIATDNQNNLWIGGTYKSSIIKYDGINAVIYDGSNTGMNFTYVQNIYIDDYDNKWFTSSNGYFYYDNTSWSNVTKDYSGLSDNETYSLLIGKNNINYISTIKGIDKYSPAIGWKHIDIWNQPALDGFYYQQIVESSIGDIIINTGRGITTVSNGVWTVWHSSNFDPFLIINKIKLDSQGILWGACNFGLLKYDGNNWELLNDINSGMPNIHLYDLDIDSENNIWCGSTNSILKYDGSSWTEYTASNSGILNSSLYNIAVDKNNVVIATFTKGVSIIENGTVTNFTSSNSPLLSTFLSTSNIEIDKENNVWISDRNYGAYIYKNDGSWSTLTKENSGLNTNYLREIYSDSKDNLWFVSQDGLAKYDGTNWQYLNTSNSGIGTNICRSLFIDSKGNFWVGSYAGLSFHDSNLLDIKDEIDALPIDYGLSQNYPNPFNPTTSITYQIPKSSFISLKIYDLLGKEIASIVNELKQAGEYTENISLPLSSGIYFYRLQTDEYTATKKMIMLK